MKPIIPTFAGSHRDIILERPPLPTIKVFFALAGGASFAFQVAVLWTPVKDRILVDLMGVSPDMARATSTPLFLYSFIGVAVTFRAYCTSWATALKETSALTSSAFVRFGVVVIAGTLLPLLGVHGAVMGIASLLAGFATEAATVVWTTHNLHTQRRKELTEEEGKETEGATPKVAGGR